MLLVRQRVHPGATLPAARRPAKGGESIFPRNREVHETSLFFESIRDPCFAATSGKRARKRPVLSTVGVWGWEEGGALLVSQMGSVAALGSGATANLVRFSWLAHRNKFLEIHRFLRVATYPPKARFRFGDGRRG